MQLYNADCLEILPSIPDKSIDMILCDLPYGTTRNKWDVIIPLDKLWLEYKRIIKDHGVIALHSDMPFTATLVNSAKDIWRYELIWQKPQGTDFLNANRKPLKAHESIQIFYKKLPVYHPQKGIGKNYKACSSPHTSENWGDFHGGFHTDCTDGSRFPTTVIKMGGQKGLHPTQKPVELEQWLIRTYTDENDVVLDNCMGSGTTGVAAMLENRDFIGIEQNEQYFKIGKNRIQGTSSVSSMG